MTNRERSKDKDFVKMCKFHRVTVTKRQASKFMMGKGLLYHRWRPLNSRRQNLKGVV